MVARVTLEIALGKEFDYLVPAELADQISVGTRVQVPLGRRKVMGIVTGLVDTSPHPNLKPILRAVGTPSLLTPGLLRLARWISEYYCCPLEVCLKTVLPVAVRREQPGWRQQLFVRALPFTGEFPKLPKRQLEVWHVIEERRELPLSELLDLADTTAATVRRLEDKGLIAITPQITERDPYAHEYILPTHPLELNPAQARALEAIKRAMRGTGAPPVALDAAAKAISVGQPVADPTAQHRLPPHLGTLGPLYHVTWRTAENLVLPPEAREKVLAACQHWHEVKMKCYLACVMADCVHLLVKPLPGQAEQARAVESLNEILRRIKSESAHEVNRLMGRTGPVWGQESYHHLIGSEGELRAKWNYIWSSPRVLGLVGPTETYPFIWAPPEAFADTQVIERAAECTEATRPLATHQKSPVFLLHGVTGSGKTEVYLQAIAHALELGKGAIVLVPEISLTPQTVERFKARFCHGPNRTLVAVLHSHLSAGERHDEWHKIRQGRARIVIGARSAIFAPVHPLGLIIVDEEHEQTYKQEEAPRYHARDVAIVRGQLEGAVVVLGSATPSLESYYNARRGKYTLLELPERVDGKKMPYVRVIDMRQAARIGKGVPIFSGQLKEAIAQRLERGEQTILFLNRRGYSTALECPLCGYVAKCTNCSLALTYHRRDQVLLCHICGYTAPVPAICPNEKCRNPRIRYAGLGTEKVEATLAKLFPLARISRMDSDVMKRKEDYRRLLADFRAGKIDVLVGTQMIAKGLHFPNVTLVGIVYADLALHQPDFRAAERTFQLLTQVAGRAGRGEVEGEVLVQAFTPFHPAIQYARRHDYTGFYEQEIEFRQQLKYPPITRVALLTLRGRNEQKVKFTAEHLRRELDKIAGAASTHAPDGAEGGRAALAAPDQDAQPDTGVAPQPQADTDSTPIPDLIIAGPAPAPLQRAMTYYRYQIMLRTRQMVRLSQRLAKLAATFAFPEGVTLAIDIDPVDLL